METLTLDDIEARLVDPTFLKLLRSLFCVICASGTYGVDEEVRLTTYTFDWGEVRTGAQFSNLGFPIWLLLQEEAAAASLTGTSGHAAWPTVRDAFSTLLPALLGKLRWPPPSVTEQWPRGEPGRSSLVR
jgi:hypothetical protein